MYKTAINIVPNPVHYDTLTKAYSTIKGQFNPAYVDNKEVYYIDVKEQHTGDFAGYLGEYYV
mgnify:CR=1 FL=1